MKKVFLALMFIFVGCDYAVYHDQISPTQGGLENGNSVCATQGNTSQALDIVTYEKVRSEVFESRCFSCHGSAPGSGGVNLSTFQGAKAWASQIDFDVKNNIMPKSPNPPLSQAEKDLISAWVSAGAPSSANGGTVACGPTDNTDTNVPTPLPTNDPLTEVPQDFEINYDLVREKVFKLRCFACHTTAGGNADGVNLETYFNSIDEIDDIKEVISQQEMPPRPRPPLNEIERTVILRWIQLGSPK